MRRDNRFLRRAIPLSILFHLLLVAVLLWSTQDVNRQKADEEKWVEVILEDSRPQTRIVDSDAGREVEKAAPDAFLGEKTRVVRKQTVQEEMPRLDDKVGPDKKRARQTPPPSQQQEKPKQSSEGLAKKARPLQKFGLAILPSQRQKQAAPSEDRPNYATYNSDYQGVRTQDYVKGFKKSEETALNTKEFIFYGYFKRIRERLDRAWRPILRRHIERIYRHGRQIASEMEHTTKTLVTLNQEGEIVRVRVLEESGTRDLDDAAVGAFNKAGPFPNPPKDLVGPAGEIEIRWDFVLRT